jgi:hypothetical protein
MTNPDPVDLVVAGGSPADGTADGTAGSRRHRPTRRRRRRLVLLVVLASVGLVLATPVAAAAVFTLTPGVVPIVLNTESVGPADTPVRTAADLDPGQTATVRHECLDLIVDQGFDGDVASMRVVAYLDDRFGRAVMLVGTDSDATCVSGYRENWVLGGYGTTTVAITGQRSVGCSGGPAVNLRSSMWWETVLGDADPAATRVVATGHGGTQVEVRPHDGAFIARIVHHGLPPLRDHARIPRAEQFDAAGRPVGERCW